MEKTSVKVSIIIPITGLDDRTDKSRNCNTGKKYDALIDHAAAAWIAQTYENIQIIFCADRNAAGSVKLKLIKSCCKNIIVIETDNYGAASYLTAIETALNVASGEYAIIADPSAYYPVNYLEKMADLFGKNDVISAETVSLFPAGRKDFRLYSYNYFKEISSDRPLETFINEGLLWTYQYSGSKIIKTDILRRAYVNIKNSGLQKVSTKYYPLIESLIIMFCVYANAGSFSQSAETVVIFEWAVEDAKISLKKEQTDIAEIKILKKIRPVLENLAKENGISQKNFDRFMSVFLNRYWWRVSWVYPENKRAFITKMIVNTLELPDVTLSAEEPDYDHSYERTDIEKGLYPTELDTENMKPTSKNVHIYVSMHKESYVPAIESLIPIQVGAALNSDRFSEMIHDDDGENISEKNKRYCELTAQYWAWKNDPDADYYGFWHYRRYLTFNTEIKADRWGNIPVDRIDEKKLHDLNISESSIQLMTSCYDIILPEDWMCDEGDGPMTVYQHWCKHFYENDMQVLCDVVHELYPEYDKSLRNLLLSYSAPFCNLFIMRKDIFLEYCDFCFSVLEEIEKRVDHDSYNVEQYRTLGHLAERMVGVFVRNIEETRPEIRILRVPTVLIKDTRPAALINPIKNDKETVVLALACDNKFVPYTSVLLRSVCENADSKYFYDIVLMHRDISEKNQNILKLITKKYDNISLRFADVSRNFARQLDLHVDRHLSLETYYRFMIPDIMPEYDKVLYLDCDMVADKDIAELYFTDIDEYSIGAVRDVDFAASYNNPERKLFYDEKIMRFLQLDRGDDYFQAGCILFNLKKIRSLYSTEYLFEKAMLRDWYYHDQDVLNYVFAGDVYYLNQKWNILTLLETNSERERLIRLNLPAKYMDVYNEARKDIGIIHFAGIPKPWHNLECDQAELFWKYARKTPYYEELLQTLNGGYFLPYGSVVFISENIESLNKCSALFDINVSGNVWSENYVVIDFIFMSDHFRKEIVRSALFACISIVEDGTGNTEFSINRFEFASADFDYLLKDNIGYRIIDNKSVRVYARQVQKFEGVCWRVRELQSRDFEKPSVTVVNEGFVFANEDLTGISFANMEVAK